MSMVDLVMNTEIPERNRALGVVDVLHDEGWPDSVIEAATRYYLAIPQKEVPLSYFLRNLRMAPRRSAIAR
jgi:hypothetical protein